MRYLLPIIALALLIGSARAQVCPATPQGYQRQYRPDGVPANYPPAEEPACYMQNTLAANQIPSCNTCHIPWRLA